MPVIKQQAVGPPSPMGQPQAFLMKQLDRLVMTFIPAEAVLNRSALFPADSLQHNHWGDTPHKYSLSATA